MAISFSTWLAFFAATAAVIAWAVAAWRQRSGGGWGKVCLIVMLFCAWFSGVYAGILLGVLDSQAVGQIYLRPATGGLLLLLIGVSLRFWAR